MMNSSGPVGDGRAILTRIPWFVGVMPASQGLFYFWACSYARIGQAERIYF